MLFKVIVCLLFVSLVSTRSGTEGNNRYIIVLREGSSLGDIERVKEEIATQEQGDKETLKMEHVNKLIPMVFATVTEDTVMKILELPEVSYVERDQLYHMLPLGGTLNTSKWLDTSQETDRWGLDILNKPAHQCRNNEFDPPNGGKGVDIYILDTGILMDHCDFEGADGKSRASYGGFDAFPEEGRFGKDCNGHGTHVAGTAGGLESGVAKEATLLSIRVLDCSGSGTTIGIIDALNFVAEKHEESKLESDFVGSVVSMSLGGGYSSALNSAVDKVVARGITTVTASGNDGLDACNLSPGSAKDNINVGAHDKPAKGADGQCSNKRASFSSYGTCVDIIAPGVDIISVEYKIKGTKCEYKSYSGTSMACPHVSGMVALLVTDDKTLSPADIKAKIKALQADDIDRSDESKTVQRVSKSQRAYIPSAL